MKPWRVKRNLKARRRANQHRLKTFFFQPTVKPAPHYAAFSRVTNDVLDTFCTGKGNDFLRLPRLMKQLNAHEHGEKVHKLVNRHNIAAKYVKTARTAYEMEPYAEPIETASYVILAVLWFGIPERHSV